MPMYAMATIPLIKKLKDKVNDINQVWYADDASEGGKIKRLREWWDQLNAIGPKFGYFPNVSKTWLVTKEDCLSEAVVAFNDMNIKVTSEGRPYLGVPISTEEYILSFVRDKVKEWVCELNRQAIIAKSSPHATYAAFSHGMTSKWVYLSRTMPGIGPSFTPPKNNYQIKINSRSYG